MCCVFVTCELFVLFDGFMTPLLSHEQWWVAGGSSKKFSKMRVRSRSFWLCLGAIVKRMCSI